jgi:hypothetical protein
MMSRVALYLCLLACTCSLACNLFESNDDRVRRLIAEDYDRLCLSFGARPAFPNVYEPQLSVLIAEWFSSDSRPILLASDTIFDIADSDSSFLIRGECSEPLIDHPCYVELIVTDRSQAKELVRAWRDNLDKYPMRYFFAVDSPCISTRYSDDVDKGYMEYIVRGRLLRFQSKAY